MKPLWTRMTNNRRLLVSNLLIAVGCMLLLYVGWAYFMMWNNQRTLARQWHEHHEQPVAPGAKPQFVDDGLVQVLIPKASVDAIVVDGVTRKMLAVGPGHMPSTPMPGENGNSVISAHRDTFFRKIGDLQKGDDVIVRRAGKVFHFAVANKKIVDPDDLSVLKQTKSPELTLITCYPTYFIGPAPKRLIVVSQLTSSAPDRGELAANTPAGSR
jgi:sortase A